MRRTRLAATTARFLLGIAAVAGTGIVLVAQLGRSDPLIDQLNALLSLLLPALALALALALRHRDRVALGAALLGLGVGGWQLGSAAFEGFDTRAAEAAASGPEIKVLTLSAFHANPDPAALGAVVTAEAPDIAVLQETNGTAAAVVDRLLPGFHRVAPCKQPHCTLTILSRWPMRRLDARFPPHRAPPDIVVGEVDAPFGRFRVLNIHMPRPYQDNAPNILINLATFVRVSHGLPTIMAGDFNTAAGSFGLRSLAEISALHRRNGFIPTYPANRAVPAFAGIDHVFADARWSSAGCRRTAAGRSDHYGVVCRLRLVKAARS